MAARIELPTRLACGHLRGVKYEQHSSSSRASQEERASSIAGLRELARPISHEKPVVVPLFLRASGHPRDHDLLLLIALVRAHYSRTAASSLLQ